MENKTNGAITKYTIWITPTVNLHDNDVFLVDFPPELHLPLVLVCSTDSPYIVAFTCTRGLGTTVKFTLTEVSDTLEPLTEVSMNVDNIGNAVSRKPSGFFNNIHLHALNRESGVMDDVSTYLRDDVFVENTFLANIPTYGSKLRQGSYVEGEENVVRITFKTDMKLPNTTAIMITLPPVMSAAGVDTDNVCKQAFVKLNSVDKTGFECHWQG